MAKYDDRQDSGMSRNEHIATYASFDYSKRTISRNRENEKDDEIIQVSNSFKLSKTKMNVTTPVSRL